jgi:hypothetical protein
MRKAAGQASKTVRIADPGKPFYSLRHSGITDLRVARTADGAVAIDKDIQRYLTAHGKKDEHGGYGEYPARELKAAMNPCAPKRSKIGPQASVRRAVAIPMPTVP